jgi:thiol:disulfide interchange protein DsbC
LAEKDEIQIKVLLFPLAMHKGAREQCVATVCDKKSFDDLEGGYTSGNQCAEGAKLVDDTISLLSSKGISGTPTYLFADGRFQSGVLEPDALRQRLGLPVPPKPAGAEAAPAPPPPPAKKPPAPPKK